MSALAALLVTGHVVTAGQSVDARLSGAAADLFSKAEHVDADIAEVKAVLDADPASAPAHVLLGVAYLAKRSPELVDDAVRELRAAITLEPALVPARLYLARLYLDLGQAERAVDELQLALARTPGQPQLRALLAESQRQAGRPEAALEMATDVLAVNPALPEARYYQGLALQDLHRNEEAARTFEDVLRQGNRQPEVYAGLGRAYLDGGHVDEGIRSLTDGAALGVASPDLLIQLARAYRLKGQLTTADTWLTRARAAAPSTATSAADRRAQRDLAFEDGLIHLAQGRLPDAARVLEQVVDADSSFGEARRYLAEVYLRQGLYARALDQAKRAAALGSPLPAILQKTLDDKARVPK